MIPIVTSSYHVVSQRIHELLGVFFKHENVVINGELEKESISLVRVNRNIRPSGSHFVITREASSLQMVILGMDISIHYPHTHDGFL